MLLPAVSSSVYCRCEVYKWPICSAIYCHNYMVICTASNFFHSI